MPISRLILASASPYRRDLLVRSGVPLEAIAALGDEKSVVHPDPRVLARERANFKALDVLGTQGDDVLVIGADQVLSCGTMIFDKAQDAAEARQHLSDLSGKTHWLHSAVALARRDGVGNAKVIESFVCDVPMQMRRLSATDISHYIATGEWQGSVGAYKIEGVGAQLFMPPIGDYFSIIGMPLAEVFSALRGVGVDLLNNRNGPWS